jgi:hypothetical protein
MLTDSRSTSSLLFTGTADVLAQREVASSPTSLAVHIRLCDGHHD